MQQAGTQCRSKLEPSAAAGCDARSCDSLFALVKNVYGGRLVDVLNISMGS